MQTASVVRLTRALRSPASIAAFAAVLIGFGLLHYALTEDVPNPYAGTHLALAVTSTAVGTWVAHRRPSHPLGWALVVAGLSATMTFAAQPAIVEALVHGAPDPVVRVLSLTITGWIVARSVLFVVAPSLVPDGWPHGFRRLVLWVGLAATTLLVAANQLVWLSQPTNADGEEATAVALALEPVQRWAGAVVWMASVAAVAAMVVHVRRGAPEAMRHQRWFVAGCGLLAVPALVSSAQEVLPLHLLAGWQVDRLELVASALLPVAIVAAVLQDQMLDISVVVRRGVAHAVLMGAAALVYLLAVGVTWVVARGVGEVAPLVGAGVVAVTFQPLRLRVQRLVNRRLFGAVDDPYGLLQSVGHRLAEMQVRDEALPALAQEIGTALRLPYVAVELDLRGQPSPLLVAESGVRALEVERFPLVFAGEEIGRLVVGRQPGGEPLHPRARQLVLDLARHAGVVAHDTLLHLDLVQSRRDLVVAREEERRRLRADLHDGLGPTLASVSLGLEAAAARLEGDEELWRLLVDLNAGLRDAIDDLRRLVHGLRPPALDELGLARAVEEHLRTTNLGGKGSSVRFTLEADPLPALSAAVELAAYRIALEAVTNVQRHAGARRCWVSIRAQEGDLELVVRDDGRGLGDAPAGVGLVSMHQRAANLGGRLEVESDAAGTTVRARLPVGATPEPAAVP